MKQAFRFSSLLVNAIFEDLAGNKWIKLDEVQAAAPMLPTLTKQNFPTEQIVYTDKTEGWVLVSRETDEFYGKVQWRDNEGRFTDRVEIVEIGFDGKYHFCKAGLDELIILE